MREIDKNLEELINKYVEAIENDESSDDTFKEIFNQMMKYVDDGYDIAKYCIGEMYYCGNGVEENYEKAFDFFIELEDNDLAQFYLGEMYEMGYGVRQDYDEAIYYYKESIENHDNFRRFCWSKFHIDMGDKPRVVEKALINETDGFYLINSIHTRSDAIESLFDLGRNLYFGIIVTKDTEKAEECFEILSECEEEDIIFKIGKIYESARDYDKAIEYYEIAIEENEDAANALLSLGSKFYTGQEIPKDIEMAEKCFQILYETENALFELGQLFENEKDYDKAIEYYETAIEYNEDAIDALLLLGSKLYTGQEIPKDIDKAERCFKILSDCENPEALLKLGQLFEELNEYDRALSYYELALDNGSEDCIDALSELGKKFYSGYNVPKDYEKAKKCFELIEDEEDPEVLYYLRKIRNN